MTLPEWIFRSLSALLALSAAWVLVWAMWGDRLPWRPVKTRCPKCWYDLTGVARGEGGWFCVECAHVVKKERDLHRTCRRGWTFVPVLLLAGASVLCWAWPTIDRDGWRTTVPTWVIVHLWPIDEVAWMEGRGAREPMIQELDRRVDYNKASGTELAAWARRVESQYRGLGKGMGAVGADANARGAGAAPAKPAIVLLCVDLSNTFKNLAAVDDNSKWDGHGHCGLMPGRDPVPSAILESAVFGTWIPDMQVSIAAVLNRTVRPDTWLVNGGDDVTFRWSGTSLLVLGPQETLEEVRRFLAGLEQACALSCHGWSSPVRSVALDSNGMQVVCRDVTGLNVGRESEESSLYERMDNVRVRITEGVEPDSWADNGGDVGTIFSLGPLLLVRHTPQVQARIDAYLAELRANATR